MTLTLGCRKIMNDFDVKCDSCGETYHTDESHAGRTITCVKCNQALLVESQNVLGNDEVEKNNHNDSKTGFSDIIVGCAGAIFFLLLVYGTSKLILVYLFPELMKGLSAGAEIFIVMVAAVVFFFVSVKFWDYISFNRDEIIRIAIELTLGIGLLALIYFVYPKGITDIPISAITLGDLGRLIVVAVATVAFLINVYFFILDMRDLLGCY